MEPKRGVFDRRQCTVWRRVAILIVAVCCHAHGATVAQPPPADSTSDELRQSALDWIDTYLSEAVLFKRKDVDAFREKLKAMAPAELEQWARKTQEVRAMLGSEEWQRTDRWLKEFLKVQAIYSEEEIDDFRTRAASATPSELIEMLEDMEGRHQQLTWMRSVSERQRETSLQQAYNAENKPSSYRSQRATFGSTPSVNVAARYAGRGAPAPLINSRSVGREAVFRQVFPRGYYGRW